MDPKTMVQDAERLAQALLLDAKRQGLSHAQLLQTVEIAQRLLRATYPGTARDVFNLMQLAEATFQAVARPSDVKN